MKFAIIDTVYQGYVKHLYADGTLRKKAWAEQYEATLAGGFHTLSAWVEPLRAMGHEVLDLWGNQMPLQIQWCIENSAADVPLSRTTALQLGGGGVCGIEASPIISKRPLHVDIVVEQIKRFKPDVIVSGYLHDFNTEFLEEVKPYYKIAIGQHAAALPECDFSGYDVIISSLPNQVEWFNKMGVASHYVQLAFDSRLTKRLLARAPSYGIMFAGQITSDHGKRADSLLALGLQMDVDVFGTGPWSENTLKRSRIRTHPALWGIEMVQAMADSKMVFNCHIDAATKYANNLRLYEVPGSGSMLITDLKDNMDDILTPGKECVAYRSIDECVDLAKFYLRNEAARLSIARAGQKRIYAEHTYFHRVNDLLSVVRRHLS
jgi:hypothetical protein